MSALSAAQRIRVDELLDVLLDTPVEARADYLGGGVPVTPQQAPA